MSDTVEVNTIELMRAQFEVWADVQGYDLERSGLGYYESGGTRCAWGGWMASRAALVVELPDWAQYDDGMTTGASAAIGDCREAIEAAGVRVRP